MSHYLFLGLEMEENNYEGRMRDCMGLAGGRKLVILMPGCQIY